MAEERLGASFSIDTTQLKAGLAQANRLIRESESEFKAAAAGMDDWTKSEDGLRAKLKSLNDITAVQRQKVSALKSEYQNLIDGGLDPTSRQAVQLRTKINQEEAALRRNETEIRRQTEALDDLGSETEEAGKGFAKLGDVAKKAGAAAALAFTAAAAAVGAMVKKSLESYAQYEQLVGGVETLFKNSAGKVEEYANNAYKTAGMSANEYMETVTSFSASLLQSLGGDTQKAADYADRAITDMADNANKMGTSIESIQNAYGGFAKQNFTMLDNLKLGYGGTKEEMQRLLDDATKLSGVKYDISSYADIVDAIHVVQDEMGITGTTAKEASTTIQGSISSMKGAWQNLLTGLADENADIDGLIDNVIESVTTVIGNVLPRIKTIIGGIITMIADLLPQIPPLLADLLPELIEGAQALIQGLVAILPQIIDLIIALLPQLIQAITDMLPSILDAAIQIIVALINGLADMLPQIVDAIMEVLPILIDALIKAIPQILQAAIKLLMAIIDAMPVIIKALVKALPQIISTIVSTLLENLPMIIQAAIQLFMGIIKAIPQIVAELSKYMPQIIKGVVDGLVKGIPEMIKTGGQMLSGLFEGLIDVKAIAKKIKEFGTKIVNGIKDFFGIHSPSRLMEDTIGKNLALGIGEGFEENIGDVNKQINDAMNFEDANINVNAKNNGVNGKTSGNVTVVYQTNNYSQAHSRYELYKSKQQTAAAVKLALGGI